MLACRGTCSLAILGSGSAANKSLTHICWTCGSSEENRNYNSMCIRSETVMRTEDDLRTATAVREFVTTKCDLFVDRHSATDINLIIEHLCTN